MKALQLQIDMTGAASTREGCEECVRRHNVGECGGAMDDREGGEEERTCEVQRSRRCEVDAIAETKRKSLGLTEGTQGGGGGSHSHRHDRGNRRRRRRRSSLIEAPRPPPLLHHLPSPLPPPHPLLSSFSIPSPTSPSPLCIATLTRHNYHRRSTALPTSPVD